MKHILIVDDELGSRESLKAVFSKTYRTSLAADAESAMKVLSEYRVDLILLDVIMPGRDGLTFLKDAKGRYPDVPIIMVSAAGSVRAVVEAIRAGAYDYVDKPFDTSELHRLVERAIESSSLQRRLEILQSEVLHEFPVHAIIGETPCFKSALEDAHKAAESDSTALFCGESDTGKELVARLVHTLSHRRDEPFIAIHCAALPEALIESELFGHEKGAFTSADSRKLGRFDLAGAGTLFFDEVGEMSITTQVKLLRVLQEREYMRIGGTKVIRTNARIVAATARDLKLEIESSRFRADLFYRLSVIPIRLPPLRERKEDIPLLTRYFLDYFRRKIPVGNCELHPSVMELLQSYNWPGNIRELKNLIERVLVLHGKKGTIHVEDLPEEFLKRGHETEMCTNRHPLPPPENQNLSLAEAVSRYERQLIEHAMKDVGGIQTQAAKLLGTTRRVLRYRIEKLGIHHPE